MDKEIKESLGRALHDFRSGYNNEQEIVGFIEALVHAKLAEAFETVSDRIEKARRIREQRTEG